MESASAGSQLQKVSASLHVSSVVFLKLARGLPCYTGGQCAALLLGCMKAEKETENFVAHSSVFELCNACSSACT